MSEISPECISVPLHSSSDRVSALEVENARLQAALESSVVEQAKGAISARLRTTPDVAYQLMVGLARSQRRNLREYAARIVASAGRLDA